MSSIAGGMAHGANQSRKAAASGWIGSALEYYDFFIYATAASLIFPQIFFPSGVYLTTRVSTEGSFPLSQRA